MWRRFQEEVDRGKFLCRDVLPACVAFLSVGLKRTDNPEHHILHRTGVSDWWEVDLLSSARSFEFSHFATHLGSNFYKDE